MRYRRIFFRQPKGFALVLTLIFVTVFFVLSASMFTQSSASVLTSANQHTANTALNAALSGLECARYYISKVNGIDVTFTYQQYKGGDFSTQAESLWQTLCTTVGNGLSVAEAGTNRIRTNPVTYDAGATFTICFERSNPFTITAVCTGTSGSITRTVSTTLHIDKEEDEILSYGLVGRGRMWLTGDTTIYGDIYTSWDNAGVSPFNTTSETSVLGSINTALSKATIDAQTYQLETLDSQGNALFAFGQDVYTARGDLVTDTYGTIDDNGYLLDSNGLPVYDRQGQRVAVNYANRLYSSRDEVQGYHEGIHYGSQKSDIENLLDISQWDTSVYYDMTVSNPIVPLTRTETVTTTTRVRVNGRWQTVTTTEEVEVPVTTQEYFPHGEGGYNQSKSGSISLTRNVYTDMTFNNAYLSSNQNALFENCTFDGVLYIDCAATASGAYNNIRFNNCTFNGVITTNTPSALKWQQNALYFTGSANFQNTSDIQEATILAPHFNVNLGDANNGEVESDENVITGAVVGGIVDIRGNAKIFGTVISMCDTSQWTSGYVTNIGATLNDGGSETTSIEDVGTIEITPDKEQLLFPGLKEYPCTISLKADSSSYTEVHN
jgi:hypothetical protein